jgi:hypothetical protein
MNYFVCPNRLANEIANYLVSESEIGSTYSCMVLLDSHSHSIDFGSVQGQEK